MIIKDLFKIFTLASATFCLVTLGLFFIEARSAVRATPALLNAQIVESRTQVLNTTADLYRALGADIRLALKTTDNRMASIQANANAQLSTLTAVIDKQLTATNTSVSTLTTAYAGLPASIGERVDPFTDCRRNSLCWQNQVSDNLFAARTTLRDVSGTMFTLNAAVPKLTSDMSVSAGAF